MCRHLNITSSDYSTLHCKVKGIIRLTTPALTTDFRNFLGFHIFSAKRIRSDIKAGCHSISNCHQRLLMGVRSGFCTVSKLLPHKTGQTMFIGFTSYIRCPFFNHRFDFAFRALETQSIKLQMTMS